MTDRPATRTAPARVRARTVALPPATANVVVAAALLSLLLMTSSLARNGAEASILGTAAFEALACKMCGIHFFGLLCCIKRSQCCNFSGRTLGVVEDTVGDVGKKLGILPLPFRR